MPDVYLESRLEFLRRTQNGDGGWGYFPGKASWLEPTAYAMLALHGEPASLDRGWSLIRSWQLPDGSFRPGSQVREGTWVTAHALTLAALRGVNDSSVQRSVDWLLATRGAEVRLAAKAAAYFHLLNTNLDLSHTGWPWLRGNSAWIEPTAHTLIALKKANKIHPSARLLERIRDAENMILSRRCSDGGWNSGSPNALSYDMRSYPETTALALLGLQGRPIEELVAPLDLAKRFRQETRSSLAKAWLNI